MIILRQKEFTRAEKEAMFQLMRLTKGFKSLPKELNSVENAKRFKKFSNRLAHFARDPKTHKLSAEELKEMKGFLSDIGATKLADNFEPIVNKYYGLDNVEAWKRLKLREERLPAKAIENRFNKFKSRGKDLIKAAEEVESYDSLLKSTKGKSSKEIFSSPDGKLMKKIIKGETGEVNQPSLYFDNVKGRSKMANSITNEETVFDRLLGINKEARKRRKMKELASADSSFFTEDNGHKVFINQADPHTLSHELGHSKSYKLIGNNGLQQDQDYARATAKHIGIVGGYWGNATPVSKRWRGIYDHAAFDLPKIAEENMANAYGRDIIRKYGGKNVNKHLADYDKMVDNLNMKSYLNEIKADRLTNEAESLKKLRDKSQ